MKRVAGYYRVSTKDQAGERNVSLAVQRQKILDFVAREGYLLVGEYTDVQSGRRDSRTQYQQLLAACRRGEVDIVAVMFLDRFGRDEQEIMLQVLTLRKQYSVETVCTEEDITHFVLLALGAWKAGEESKRTASRMRPAMMRKVQGGAHWGPAPFGWRKDPGGRFVVHEPEAAIVRTMAHWLVHENMTLRGIAGRLQAELAPSASGHPWSLVMVSKILRRDRNAGTLRWGKPEVGDTVTMDVPPLISAELAAAVRARLALHQALPRGRSHAAPHLLAGLLRCGNCGRAIVGGRESHTPAQLLYRCGGWRDHNGCITNRINAAKLDAAVVEALAGFSDAELAAQIAPSPEPDPGPAPLLDAARQELVELERALLKEHRLLRDGLVDDTQFAQITRDLAARRIATEERIVLLQQQLAAYEARRLHLTEIPRRVRSFAEDFEALSVPQRKARLQELVERVTFTKGDGKPYSRELNGTFTITLRL